MTVDGTRQFVDTNILVYAHDISAGAKHRHARSLIQTLWESGQGCLSIQVLQEFYVTISRKVGKPLSPDAAKTIIAAWEHGVFIAQLSQMSSMQFPFKRVTNFLFGMQ